MKTIFTLEKPNTPEYFEELKHCGFEPYEDAVKDKKRLKYLDNELYSLLATIEKYLDYQKHENDFGYIRDDFVMIEKIIKREKYTFAYAQVDRVVTKSKKENNTGEFSFDIIKKKLGCRTGKKKEIFSEIKRNEVAAKY